MNCDECDKEDLWLEAIGTDFVCRKCIKERTILGKVLTTDMDSFQFILRKLKVQDFSQLKQITLEQIETIGLKSLVLKLLKPRKKARIA